MKENKYYYLRVTDRKILWAVSGGVCAKCKKKIVNIETGEVYAHEAHVIARKGKNLVSFANISMHDKDCYKNLLILCPTCHIETRNWSHKALLELKTVHEKHVDNLLNGSFNPIERGEGKLFTHQFISYSKFYMPFNKTKGLIGIFTPIIAMGISFFMRNFDTSFSPDIYSFSMFILMCLMVLFFMIYQYVKKPKSVSVRGKCIFVGCKGFVNVKELNDKQKAYNNIRYKFIGICDHNDSHTFTVSNDKTMGEYEKM